MQIPKYIGCGGRGADVRRPSGLQGRVLQGARPPASHSHPRDPPSWRAQRAGAPVRARPRSVHGLPAARRAPGQARGRRPQGRDDGALCLLGRARRRAARRGAAHLQPSARRPPDDAARVAAGDAPPGAALTLRQLRTALRVGVVTEPPATGQLETVGQRLREEVHRRFGRSLHIRQVDAGSCNGCELEISGLTGPHYDLERFGLHFVASPRHADCLLVTGPVTRNMAEALRRTWEATPDPKLVGAVGNCGLDGGLFRGSYAVVGGVADVVPVDAVIPGCPPPPAALLAGLLEALGRLPR